jgi:hypothetical protein
VGDASHDGERKKERNGGASHDGDASHGNNQKLCAELGRLKQWTGLHIHVVNDSQCQ